MNLSSLTPDKQVKLQYWMDVIRQCRASGLTNQIWCEQHDISLKSYYYWLSKIRKLALEELPRKTPIAYSVRSGAAQGYKNFILECMGETRIAEMQKERG